MSVLSTVLEILLIFVLNVHCQNDVYYKGAYEHSNTELPCLNDIPEVERTAVWWRVQGQDIGIYTKEAGFQPSGNFKPGKFNITSLKGTLLVFSVNKTSDDVMYDCGLTTTSGDNYTNATTVKLEIGNEPHDFYIYTNGSKIGSECYDHVGLGPMTCTVVSDPPSNITWILKSNDDSYCQSAISNSNTSCVPYGKGQFNCSNTLVPNSGCYGYYDCVADYVLGDINLSIQECVLVVESEDWWLVFYIILGIVVALIVLAIIIAVLLSCCGIIACTACAGGAAVLGCAGCMECCDKRRNINPATDTVVNQNHDSYVPTYTITKEQFNNPTYDAAVSYDDAPPAYQDLNYTSDLKL